MKIIVKDLIKKILTHRIKVRLKRCGQNVALGLPITIEGKDFVEIGDDVSIAAYVHIWGHGGVTIGNKVLIASHCAITSLTHDYNARIMYDAQIIRSHVTIADNVWIGSHSVILPGITINEGAVVGAGSIVTRDVPANAIVVGNPAKIIKFRNDE